MSSPYGSMDAINASHNALAIDPHVATAVWAIVLAMVCALVIIIAEMVKQRNTPAEAKRQGKNPPPP
ncbi:MAG TPA: hypothetical protein VHX19_23860 [Stellaceae bacterium]|nr:hypothetical protein [Stellaceae bacterium]